MDDRYFIEIIWTAVYNFVENLKLYRAQKVVWCFMNDSFLANVVSPEDGGKLNHVGNVKPLLSVRFDGVKIDIM